MTLWQYALRELKNNRKFCLFYVFNLCLGLTGFIALNGFSASLDHAIKNRSRAVLGGDLGMSSRRPIAGNEVAIAEKLLGSNIQKSQTTEMFSMIATEKQKTLLVQLKAIEENYPFYGSIELVNQGAVNAPLQSKLKTENRIWIYADLVHQLQVNVGDSLKIGDSTFVIDDIIKTDPAAGISTNMAPRIFLNRNHLEKTNLIKKGTIAWNSVIFHLPGRDNTAITEARDAIFKALDTPDVRVFTHENASEQMANIMVRLNDFLGLTSLVALFLAGIGSAFLFRSYFRKNLKQIAILISLGAQRQTAYSYYILQIFVLGLSSFFLATLLSLAVMNGLTSLTKELLPADFTVHLTALSLLISALVSTFGSIAISLPTLLEINSLSPAVLLTEATKEKQQISWPVLLSVLPGLFMFWGLAILLAKSYFVGSIFTGLFLASGVLLAFIGVFLFTKVAGQLTPRYLSLRLALRNLARNQLTTAICFVAIGLSSLLLNLIPQLRTTLTNELRNPLDSKLPSFFLFDVQQDQVDEFGHFLQSKNIKASNISPMIIARLVKVNDQDFDKGSGADSDGFSREEEREMRFRNRGFNLSYRAQLTDSETIAKGVDFRGAYQEGGNQLPEISVEKRFAERLGLKINDKLTFDIESIPIEGRIVNLRHVRWTSFQPNFFVQFQPGVLEIAPKTFIATLPQMADSQKAELQNSLVEKFPNISLIDVSKLIESIGGILEQMALALTFMSILCLLTGFVVIYSIANHQATAQKWEIGLLKTLGAQFTAIRMQFIWQFSLISVIAILVGALLSIVANGIFATVVFNSVWVINWTTPLATVIGGLILTAIVTDAATRSSLRTQTKDLFSN